MLFFFCIAQVFWFSRSIEIFSCGVSGRIGSVLGTFLAFSFWTIIAIKPTIDAILGGGRECYLLTKMRTIRYPFAVSTFRNASSAAELYLEAESNPKSMATLTIKNDSFVISIMLLNTLSKGLM